MLHARENLLMDAKQFQSAAEELTQILGPEGVDLSDATRDRYARSTSLSTSRPLAVLYPTCTEQVRGLVRIASRFGFAIYPISQGRNWGYGDASAPTDGQIIVDLNRMNRIVEVNADLAFAVIEPGVTQGQLFDYLRSHGIPLCVDCTAAGCQASLLGNALERGFGHTPYSDHFSNICGMQVVLADGRILDTGLCHYAEARARRVYPYGVGPSLDGLFAQSNFGIVTQTGVWLMPQPEAFCAFFIRAERDQDLESIVERLAPLRLRGLLQSAVHVGNDLRVISARMRYPWQRAGHQTPLPHQLRMQLRCELGVGAWNVAGGIYGNARTVRAVKRTLSSAMKPYRVQFLNDRKLKSAQALTRILRVVGLGKRLAQLLESINPTYRLLKGEPTDEPLRGAAWRVRGGGNGESADPRDVHAGLIWASPVLPTTSEAAREVVAIIEPIFFQNGFEPLITFSMVNERAMVCVTNVTFDTRQTDESARAVACDTQLQRALMAAGYVPYRTGPRGYGDLVDSSSVFWDVARQIKNTLDPRGIVSPGRYLSRD